MTLNRRHLLKEALNPRPGVDRHRDQGKILRKCQYAVGAEVMLQAEALRSAQHHADLDLLATVQVEQRIGEECLVGSVALAEVSRELEAVVVHR